MQYLLPMARNTVTHEVVKEQDLSGGRFNLNQRRLAEDQARRLAAKMTARTSDPWQGFVKEYTPTQRR
jgi:type IV secretory pathway VirD2 relaxase